MGRKKKKKDHPEISPLPDKVKFEIYGHEIIEKIVNASGNSGRVYLPPDWIGRKVKVIKC